MATFKVKTKNKVDIDKKPRVYFTCHPDDFETCFQKICNDIFKTHDCAIYYTQDMNEAIGSEEREVDLGRINLFVVPVTTALLTTPNRAMDEDIPHALAKHIPVLPIMMESGIDELYSKPDKFGQLQYLNPHSQDFTEIFYEEKLKKYLESVLISDKLATRVRAAFDAYIFLSYRKKDRKYANELMRLIHSIPQCRDIAIWFDEFLTPGESFKDSIDKILHDSKLFTLLVTPNLLEETDGKPNFVMAEEYPAARKSGKPILPAEMEETDKEALCKKYEGLPACVKPGDAEFHALFVDAVSSIAVETNNTPEHNFLIGLAYLDGIDVEVNREFALELITGAAEAELPEAMNKLICIYSDGIGVSINREEVQKWSARLADYYFKRAFSKDGIIASEKEIAELFENYKDQYWAETIRSFLLSADAQLPMNTVKALYALLMSFGICEYTLLFDTCNHMTRYPEQTRILLLADILTKSANKIYPPYGPLFWYVPEYGLYETLLFTLEGLQNAPGFAKMLALVRDVCWILGHKNTCKEITEGISGDALYEVAKAGLSGVRDSLCRLFFTGHTDYSGKQDIYPRCFNVAEAVSFKENGCGVIGRMTEAFSDELGLFSHTAYNELDREYIGIVACPYVNAQIEHMLTQRGCHKLTGLILSPSENNKMEYLAINKRNIAVMYIPENITAFDHYEYLLGADHSVILEWDKNMSLSLNITTFGEDLLYFYSELSLPADLQEIPSKAFWKNTGLKKIRIPGSVKVIGNDAFLDCTALTSVHISEGVAQIHAQAFSGCKQLEEVCLPDSVVQLDDYVFSGCSALTTCHIPAGVTQIGRGLFSGCHALTAVQLPPHLVKIPDSAFSFCRSLTSVQIPYGVTKIGESAFKYCKALTMVNIPKSVTKIDKYTFDECKSLAAIDLPEHITEICSYAFHGCSSLTSIRIPDGVTNIGAGAFYGCSSLTSIWIPDSVTVLGMNAFFYCDKLASVEMNIRFKKEIRRIFPPTAMDKISYRPNADGELPKLEDQRPPTIPYGTEHIPDGMFANNTVLQKLKIPRTVITIGENAFSQCQALKSVRMPDSVREIGQSAFSNCNALKKVRLSRNLKTIGNFAFYGCSLQSVRIPKGVTEIGYAAFDTCLSLRSVHIPKSVTKIDSHAFNGCMSLRAIKIPNGVKEIGPLNTFSCCSSLQWIRIPQGIETIGMAWFNGCSSLTKAELPDSITEISGQAFSGCRSLVSIDIPKGVQKIGSSAFRDCSSLTSVCIPDGVTELESDIFSGCTSLTSLCIPKGITKIGSHALQNCSTLSHFDIPHCVTSIGFGAFSGCRSLTSVKVPEGISQIDSGTFCDCSSLVSVHVPGSITKIGVEAFRGCGALTAFEIPANVRTIWERAFQDCSCLTAVEIPCEVRIIGDDAFRGCTGLTSVRISRRFEGDIGRIFGDINRSIISFID